jgi:uncharacterized protein (TIGR03086 family)
MDIVDRLDGAFTSTGRFIALVTPEQLSLPTVCSEWDVRALLNHTTGVVARLGAAAARTPLAGDRTDWVGTDAGAEFEQVAKVTLSAWSQPGALEGTCGLSFGEMPAEVVAGINFLDTLVHGWDVAKAVGVDPTLDPTLASAALEVAKMVVTDERRGGKGFGNAIAIAAGSAPTDELVAFVGRQP